MIIFDSSAIYMAISEGKTKQTAGEYTTMLAMFELGNIVWKKSILARVYSQKEALELLKACEMVLEKMRTSHPNLENIYHVAARCHISFYDATYVCLAEQLKAPLVTLDHKLADKVRSFVDIMPLKAFKPKNEFI